MSLIRQLLPKPWPVIVNLSLSNSEVRQLLEQNHKVRVSETTCEDSVIFPLSSVAFLLLELDLVIITNAGGKRLDPQVIKRLERFHQIHRHCYVIATSNVIAENQVECLMALQGRFSNTQMGFIPAHNPKEIINCMMNIAKVTCKPLSQIIQDRLQNLQSSTLNESVILHILSNLGLTMHECLVLHDGCHSIANIATASIVELMDCSLDQITAKKIISFFEKDYI